MIKYSAFFIFFFAYGILYGQEYSYTRYDLKEGLAGSNVYAAVQDKEGFLWFGTETGLSRFDGSHFRNFTTEDGLPDNEIINLYCDSKGRVWIVPFKNSVCYYFKGRIHTQQNDSILAKFNTRGIVMGIQEDMYGNIAFLELYDLQVLFSSGILRSYQRAYSYSNFTGLSISASGHLMLFTNGQCQEMQNGQFIPFKSYDVPPRFHDIAMNKHFMLVRNAFSTRILYYDSANVVPVEHNPSHITYSLLNDSVYFDNGSDGTTMYIAGNPKFARRFLPGKAVSKTFEDDEKNLWFCTQHDGVYKLNSPNVNNITFKDKKGRFNGIQTILGVDKKIWMGTDYGKVFTLDLSKPGEVIKDPPVFEGVNEEPIVGMLLGNNNHIYFGEDSLVWDLANNQIGTVTGGVKDLAASSSGLIGVGTSNGVTLLDPKADLSRAGYPRLGRSTCIHWRNDTIFIGTLNGLYWVRWGNMHPIASSNGPIITGRISSIMESADGTLWVGTYGNGVLAIKNGKIVARISKESGLSSNICRKLFLHGNILWVGTDVGVNKIDINDHELPIRRYTATDGLLSDFITSIYADDSLVYVGTPIGLSIFDDSNLYHSAPCRLRIRDLIVSGKSISRSDAPVELERRDNNIRIEYSGISYRSGGDIQYRYFLEGLDTAWNTTRDNFLNYPTLEPGKYTMHLLAINKFGTRSEELAIPFSIAHFWWEEWYYRLVGLLLVVGLVILLVKRRLKKVRIEEKEKVQLYEKLVTMEHMALRAQMNPHFIFNSLNSIQHFVMEKDIMGANQYLAGLSKLIRLTLDYSVREEIRTSEEIEYIKLYLELERSRTSQKFDYTIDMPPDMKSGDYFLPPLILQPFVENSIRHGIRYREDKNGHIFVQVRNAGNSLHYVVRDNGVGREKAASYKKFGHIEYQSRGIELTVQRIGLLSRNNGVAASVTISDLKDEAGAAAGTEVIVVIPN